MVDVLRMDFLELARGRSLGTLPLLTLNFKFFFLLTCWDEIVDLWLRPRYELVLEPCEACDLTLDLFLPNAFLLRLSTDEDSPA